MEIVPSAEGLKCFSFLITAILFYNVLLSNITEEKNPYADYAPVLAIDTTKMAESLQESVTDLCSLSKIIAIARQSCGFMLLFNKLLFLFNKLDSLVND